MVELKYRATLWESVAVIVGIVIGTGIFFFPPYVAQLSNNGFIFLSIWLIGGIISLLGALCYAELTTAYPHEGGDYLYLSRAFGNIPSFLFVWARMAIIQTGSIAMLGFIIGDYATGIAPLGSNAGISAAIYAVASVLILTIVNATGIHRSYLTQILFLGLVITSLLLIVVSGITHPLAETVLQVSTTIPTSAQFGSALILVLLTYGGWTEAAFISHELSHSPKVMVRALITSIAIITTIYLAINYAYLVNLGMAGISSSSVVGADVMNNVFGPIGAVLFSGVIIVLALSTMNGVMITGARSNFALGRDYQLFRSLGRLNRVNGNPLNAYILQGGVAILLVAIGTYSRSGVQMMVDYITPVFWLFIMGTIVSLFVLRRKDSHIPRPFKVPLYPVLPAVFLLIAAYMFYSSVTYSGIGSTVGLAVLGLGLVAFFVTKRTPEEVTVPEEPA